jgi:hypothetical protein
MPETKHVIAICEEILKVDIPAGAERITGLKCEIIEIEDKEPKTIGFRDAITLIRRKKE